ncbi:filamentous hemagglutinin [Enterobacter sp. BIGb0383]|uniref:hemagglutinin repeat-containing protein n=1 Tax=unclassified Enterobacter TaxID=2608935 RepID=UPI000F90BF7C|nr:MULTISPECIES: hemagglutinin repeat-containing protein [unclassified Enterobacter]ROP60173.1 filamentous hemagglutinin [Enterobacter sp. BIGb0383]ROS08360.1 filamentous hemagglutinin [Enterobacter sp. BIGb0359]
MDNTSLPVKFSQRAISWLIISTLVWQPMAPAVAAVISPTGPASMDSAANGVPVLNIATPNGAGISHNQFNDYNVGKEGLILNNATGQFNQTQLGGIIQNNPNLRPGQEARGIINEVTGGSRSQLQGYTEVAGKAANVMVANPYGITCDGCGFINTPNATLTTGKPQFDDKGNLSALNVTGGTITVEGKGLDASQSDALSIIARATEVNAAIHAKDLTVTAGANRVGADGSVAAIEGEGAAPTVAVDTGALGGMYANRIHLVSSEKGVGVNLGNLNARQGDIQLDASGKLVLKDSLSSGALVAKGEGVVLNGTQQAGGNMVIAGSQDVVLNGTLVVKGELNIKAKSLKHSGTSAANSITFTAQDSINNGGLLVADNLALGASHISNSGQLQGTQALNLDTNLLDNLASGTLYSTQDLHLNIPQLNNQGTIQGLSLNVAGDVLQNSGILLSDTGMQLNAWQLNNRGSVAAKGQLTANTSWLNNTGQVQSGGTLTLSAGEATLNGTQAAQDALEVIAKTLNHSGQSSAARIAITAMDSINNGGTLVADNLVLSAALIESDGQIQGTDALNLNADRLDNQANGTIYTSQGLILNIPQLNNHGKIQGVSLSLTGNVLKNDGTLLADTDLWLNAGQMDNRGSVAAKGQLTAEVTRLNNWGTIQGLSLGVSGDTLENSGTLQGKTLGVSSDVVHSSGMLTADDALHVEAGSLTTTADSTLTSKGDITLTVKRDATLQGQVNADRSLNLDAGSLTSTAQLQSGGNMMITADSATFNGAQVAKGSLDVTANSLNHGGRTSAGKIILTAQDDITNGGTLISDNLALNALHISNSGLLQGTHVLNMKTGQLDNEANGSLYSVQSLLLNIPYLNNHGTIQGLSLGLTGDVLQNDGTLMSASDALLRARVLDNRGTVTVKGLLTAEGSTLDNSGTLEGQELDLTGDTVRNSGSVMAAGDANIRAGLLDNRATMAAKGQLTGDTQTLINSGTLQGQTLEIGGDEIQNSGVLNSAGAALVRARELTNVGVAAAKGQLIVNATTLTNVGTLQGQSLRVTGDRVQNSGTLAADGALRVEAGTLTSGAGSTITGIGDVVLSAQAQADIDGQVNATGALDIHAGVLTSQQQAQLQSGSDMTLGAESVTLNGTQAVKGMLDVKANTLTHGGKSSAAGITLNAQNGLKNSGTLVADTLNITGAQVRNSGLLQGTRALNLQTGKLDNLTGGTLYSAQGFTLSVPEFNNSGLVTTDGDLHLEGIALVNGGEINGVSLFSYYRDLTNSTAGRLLADKQIILNSARVTNDGLAAADVGSVTADTLDNSGEVAATSLLLTLTQKAINHDTGRIVADSDLTFSAPMLINHGLLAGNSLTLKQADITNGGTLQGADWLTAVGASLTNQQGGVVLSNGAMTLKNDRLVNAGLVQSDTLDLTTGEWINNGNVLGKNGLTAVVNGSFNNQGRVISQQVLTLQASSSENGGTLMSKALSLYGDVRNSGLIQGTDDLAWEGTTLVNAANGQMLSGNGLTLQGTSLDNHGQMQGRMVTATADSLYNGGTLQAQEALNTTLSGQLDNQGEILSQGLADIRTTQMQNDGKLAAKVLLLTAPELTSNGLLQGNDSLTLTTLKLLNGRQGQLVSGKALNLSLDQLENQGLLYVNGDLTLDALTLVNGGSLEVDALDATLRGTLTNTGILLAHQDATLRADVQTNSGEIAAYSLILEGKNLSNSGLVQGAHGLQATADELINNAGGRWLSGDVLTLNAAHLDNAGTLQGETLDLHGTTFDNRGTVNGLQGMTGVYRGDVTNDGLLASGGLTDLRGETLTSSGRITGDTLTLNATTLHNDGLWQGNNGLMLNADTLTTGAASRTLSGGTFRLDTGQLTTLGTLQGGLVNVATDNWTLGGSLLSQGDLTATVSDTLTLTGSLTSQRAMNVRAQTLHNDGQILSSGDITLRGQSFTNNGTVQGNSLAAHESRITNNGTLIGLNDLLLDNRQSSVATLARMALVAPELELNNGETGSLLTQGTLDITAGVVRNTGTWQGNRVLLAAQSLENGGVVQSAGALNLTLAGNLRSTTGSKITAMGTAALQALSMTNDGLWAADALMLKANSLNNSGVISGNDELTATLNGAFIQQAGATFASSGALNLSAEKVVNAGKIQGRDITVTGASLVNNAGAELVSSDVLTLIAPDMKNNGLIQGTGETHVDAATQALNNGRILSGGPLTLTTPEYNGAGWLQATDLILNAAQNGASGTLMADRLTLAGDTFTNQGLLQANDLTLNYRHLTNGGTLLGGNTLTVNATQVEQSATGKLFSGGDLFVGATGLDSLGQMVALGNLTLQLTNAFTGKAQLVAGNTLSVISDGAIDNQSVMQGQAVNLNAGGQLTNSGQITTGSGASMFSGSAIALSDSSAIQSGGDITLASRGNITTNGFTGTSGTLTMSATGAIVNTALLYAANNLALYASSIHNLRGDILAGNSLWMQKDAAGNANGEVVNTSGTIETTNGDITIRTGSLLNEREGLSESRSYQAATGSPAASGASSISVKVTSLPAEQWGYIYTVVSGPGGGNGFSVVAPMAIGAVQRYLVGSTVVNVTAKAGASRISANHDLNVSAATLNNHASNLLAGNRVNLSGASLNNQSWFGYAEDEYKVYRYSGKTGKVSSLVGKPASGNDNNRRVTYTLDGAPQYETRNTDQVFRSVIQAGGLVTANFSSDISNTATTSNGGGISHVIPAPSLNTLSNQSIDTGAKKQSLNSAGAVSSPQWNDQLQNALQQINGGGSLDSGSAAGVSISAIHSNQQGNASLGKLNTLADTGITTAELNPVKGSTTGQYQGKTVDTSAYPLPMGNNGYFVVSDNPKSPYLITINPKLDGLGDLDPALFGDLNKLLGLSPSASAPGFNASTLPNGVTPSATPGDQTASGLPDSIKPVTPPLAISGPAISSPEMVVPREINPEYTDEKLFLGSAYMLDRINLKPEYDYRFLGDAAFDTRYVSNTLLNQTGHRYLNGIGSELDQMRYLIDNAASLQQSLGLQLGVSLTADQIAGLDHSILWWEIANIGGEMVMIPKLYLSPKDATINSGSVIAGNDISLKGGNITNSGSSLLAKNDLSLESREFINNSGDSLIKAGGNLDLSSIGDISNISSAISGKAVVLESLDGSINNITQSATFSLDDKSKGRALSITDTKSGNIASITAQDTLSLDAGKNITIGGASLTSGGGMLMKAWGDIALNANNIESTRNLSEGKSKTTRASASYQGSTLSAGGNLVLEAGQDIRAQAAGMVAEKSVELQAGRDINLDALATRQADSYKASKKTVINEHVRQQGTEIASGTDTVIIAGRDMNAQAAQVTAKGDIGVQAGRDVNLTTATESDYYFKEETKTKKGFLKKTTTHTIAEQQSTRETGSLLSGDNVTVRSGNDLLVKGSAVVGDGDVALSADRSIDIQAATNTDSSWNLKEKKKSGLMGSGGIGFTIGTSKTKQDLKEKGTTQSQSMSTVGSNGGSVTLNAGEQVHIGGADLVAKKDLSLTGDSVVIESGHDKRTSDQTFEQKSSGLTVALSGAVGDVVNTAVSTAIEAKEQSDGRLASLQATKAVLSGIQAGQASRLAEAANGSDMTKNGAFGVMVSLGGQSSKSTSHSEQDTAIGSTLNAGNDLSVAANGRGNSANSGDIAVSGSQVKAGKDITLDAARDISLGGAANTQFTTGSNSSKGGSLGVGITAGPNGAGFTVSASANAGKGGEKGNGTTWNETTLDAGSNVSLTSGRDALLQSAQVNGEKVTADIGRDLTLSSLQDSNNYDSKQQSLSGGLSYTFGAGGGPGVNISYSRDKMKSNYDSVQEQTGIFAGKGGFDVAVGNHTQLDGAVIASRAEADKNRLETGTLGFTDINNKAEYKVEHQGGGFSTSGGIAGNVIGNMASTLLTGLGGSGNAEGTTQSAVADGTIIVRDVAHQQQDVSTLSRDTDHANGSIDPIFNKEKEQRRLQTAQLIGEIGRQVSDIVRTDAKIRATESAGKQMKTATADDRAAAIKALEKDKKAVTEEAISGQMYQTFYNDAFAKTEQGTGGQYQRAITAATAAIQAIAGGDIKGALAGAAAPYIANEIAKAIPEKDHAGRVLAHAVVNAALAAASGKDAGTAAAGAATGELAGMIALAAWDKTPDQLSEEEKQTVSALATLASGLAGGLVGDSGASVVEGAQAGKTTVENNSLSVKQNQDRAREMTQCQGDACSAVVEKYKKINAEQHESVVNCSGAQDCVDKANEVGQLQADYANRINELLEKARADGGLSREDQDELSVLQVTTIQLEADRNAAIHNALMSGDSSEAKQLAINSLAQVAGTSAAGIAAGIGKNKTNTGENAAKNGLKNAPETQTSVDNKLANYLLAKDHPVGGSKAEWFDKALGFNKGNSSDLAKQIVFEPGKAVKTAETQHGVKYDQVISITGANGRTIDVKFGWIKNNDGVVRLVTAIPAKK